MKTPNPRYKFALLKIHSHLKKLKYEHNRIKRKLEWAERKAQKSYAELTDNDLLYEEGREDELYGRLQQRLGKSKEEVKKLFEDLWFVMVINEAV